MTVDLAARDPNTALTVKIAELTARITVIEQMLNAEWVAYDGSGLIGSVTGAGSDWALGNGIATSWWRRTEREIEWHGRIVWGSTTTFGTDGLIIIPPVWGHNDMYMWRGDWNGLDVGTAWYTGWGSTYPPPGAPGQALLPVALPATTIITNVTPFTWAAGDYITWNFAGRPYA